MSLSTLNKEKNRKKVETYHARSCLKRWKERKNQLIIKKKRKSQTMIQFELKRFQSIKRKERANQ